MTTTQQKHNPLHGVTLEKILKDLVYWFGFNRLAELIPINCFICNPSIKSSLVFIRKTPWARAKVEKLYLKELKVRERTTQNIVKRPVKRVSEK